MKLLHTLHFYCTTSGNKHFCQWAFNSDPRSTSTKKPNQHHNAREERLDCLVAVITNSCLTPWLKMQPQAEPLIHNPNTSSNNIQLQAQSESEFSITEAVVAYLMSTFAAYRLKREHPWWRQQAGWWSSSQCRACVADQARTGPGRETASGPRPLPVNGVRRHCASVW